MRLVKIILIAIVTLAFSLPVFAQKPKFNYLAQKKFIPVDLGQVYLGMPFKAFSTKVPMTNVEVDRRFDWLELIIPHKKGNVTGLVVRVHGLSVEEKEALVKPGKVKDKTSLAKTTSVRQNYWT